MIESTTLHWIYVGIMAVSTLIFIYLWINHKDVPREEYAVATAIPIWSGIWYALMAMGFGMAQVDGQTTFWGRYMDWVITTPLLLVALYFTATYKFERKSSLIIPLIIADVFMILMGLMADFAEVNMMRYLYYGLGIAAFIYINYMVWGPLRAWAKQNPTTRIGTVYDRVAGYLTLFWIGYPLMWLLGPSGLGIVGQSVDTWLFIILPVFSKIGFSLFDLIQLRDVAQDGPVHRPEAEYAS